MNEKWGPLKAGETNHRITVKVGGVKSGDGTPGMDRDPGTVPGRGALQQPQGAPAQRSVGAGAGAAPADGEAPLRVRVSPGARGRRPSSFRQRGRRRKGIVSLAAGLAALAALAVLLPALLAGRAGPPPVPAAPTAAQAPPQPPGAEGGAGTEQLVPAEASAAADKTPVRVYLTDTGAVETLPLERYVTGVLAAEMPADFEPEALKAQAIAARTFIVRRLAAGDVSGVPGGNADVLDTVVHQAYVPQKTLEQWSKNGKGEKLTKLEQAVQETRGIVMTYRGKPITASFFSASGGFTENSEEYWSVKVPYLRSVPSPWDSLVNPNNEETVTLSLNDVFRKLGQTVPAVRVSAGGKKNASSGNLFRTISFTSGQRIKEIQVGDYVYTGREIREKLGLRSSQFKIRQDGGNVKITTYGYGHGVGMSQWGANGMAQQGYTTTQILKHYYTGISFQQAARLLKEV
ncbi:stage II sporulation protein D [Fontibacillus phaseoli]|uniref:Stage II sporulation protein D n=1 Tax=Fontibacillus phaseoli TaxID=1416533 RepID=A0A369BHF6_9BACL|nr:stage II sporulation protein D [Fontibacillus phaseoli]RCX19114.1 stage II sporulation protein D [Fontibacillus phaseoli]